MPEIEEYSGTYAIIGPPGTGKTSFLSKQTTTIMERNVTSMGVLHPTPVLLCSLTRTAAVEIAGRVQVPRTQVGTLHSHAYRALGCPEVAEGKIDEWNAKNEKIAMSGGKVDLDEIEDDKGKLNYACAGDEYYQAYCVARARMLPPHTWRPRLQEFAQRWEAWKQEASLLDFTDLIERAADEVRFAPGRPRVVIADEAQDLSRLELRLLKKWGQAAGALMIAGDPRQALYAWRGSDHTIFLDDSIPESHRRVLGQSYRVPAAVHAMAAKCARRMSDWTEIEYKPRDYPGAVNTCAASFAAPEQALTQAADHLAAGKSVMFLAACAYMVEPLVKLLRERGLPFANPWRKRRGDWNPLRAGNGTSMSQRVIDYLRVDPVLRPGPEPEKTARVWNFAELNHWLEIVQAKGLLVRGAKAAIQGMAEQEPTALPDADWLANIFEPAALPDLCAACGLDLGAPDLRSGAPWGHEQTQAALQWLGEQLLASRQRVAEYPVRVARLHGPARLLERPQLYVGTIHSFKGAEADICYICPDLSGAGKAEYDAGGPGRDAVLRMFYVAITRAREQVYVCQPAGWCVQLEQFMD